MGYNNKIISDTVSVTHFPDQPELFTVISPPPENPKGQELVMGYSHDLSDPDHLGKIGKLI